MVKLGLLIKQEAERILNEKMNDADSLFVIKYSGLSAADLNTLRGALSEIDSTLMVVKNSVGRRVLEAHQDAAASIQGPCGLVFVKNDLIAVSKAICGFAKEKKDLEVKLGLLKDRLITPEEVVALSKIPSLSALHGQLVGGLKSPITNFVLSLKQMLNKLVWVITQIKDKQPNSPAVEKQEK